MDVSSIAAAASANSASQLQTQVSVSVLKKAMDVQETHALQLLAALPPTPSGPVGATGGVIDTYA
ncbi:putative motility protein [Azoarcus sp. TTM-91]|uniref:Putative motility protein YjfB-like n=1 Tax=Azoarcus indigens TaxID=29545 RepID=A0A4R6EDF6_9RHOO|nr:MULTISPECIES: YjfB family protein [Azoarcus]NMG34807.1 putative motility protein [Azoarcus sp. TTM-91]NMG63681.1 putative motility protein [Azoarcus indigens]TDN56217.1 putative motility protein YjfB-like [Azoarcus indigens]